MPYGDGQVKKGFSIPLFLHSICGDTPFFVKKMTREGRNLARFLYETPHKEFEVQAGKVPYHKWQPRTYYINHVRSGIHIHYYGEIQDGLLTDWAILVADIDHDQLTLNKYDQAYIRYQLLTQFIYPKKDKMLNDIQKASDKRADRLIEITNDAVIRKNYG